VSIQYTLICNYPAGLHVAGVMWPCIYLLHTRCYTH